MEQEYLLELTYKCVFVLAILHVAALVSLIPWLTQRFLNLKAKANTIIGCDNNHSLTYILGILAFLSFQRGGKATREVLQTSLNIRMYIGRRNSFNHVYLM